MPTGMCFTRVIKPQTGQRPIRAKDQYVPARIGQRPIRARTYTQRRLHFLVNPFLIGILKIRLGHLEKISKNFTSTSSFLWIIIVNGYDLMYAQIISVYNELGAVRIFRGK